MSEIFASTPWLVIATVFVFSLLVGSFLNVVIHRLPIMLDREWRAQAQEMLDAETPEDPTESIAQQELVFAEPAESLSDFTNPDDIEIEPEVEAAITSPDRYNLIVPRSRCPHCNAEIKAHQNIPVLSYLLLGGKCANCKAKISARYPIVELATALLSAAVAWRFGWHWQTLAALFFTWSVVALTAIDFDHQILPDVITVPLLWLGLLLSLAWHPSLAAPAPVSPVAAIAGAAAGYLLLWSVYWAFKLITGKEGMGYGDFKLFGALGAWMGWQMLPLILLLSAFTGAVVGIALIMLRGRDRNVPMPFGPYLAAAGWIALMWGPQIVGGYMQYSGMAR